jgi:DNA mismatch endonuclease, patch repair protein
MPDMAVLFQYGFWGHLRFWHHHRYCGLAKYPASNSDFWRNKLNGNVARDKIAIKALRAAGWRVLVVWECATKGDAAEGLIAKLPKWVAGSEPLGEIPVSGSLGRKRRLIKTA